MLTKHLYFIIFENYTLPDLLSITNKLRQLDIGYELVKFTSSSGHDRIKLSIPISDLVRNYNTISELISLKRVVVGRFNIFPERNYYNSVPDNFDISRFVSKRNNNTLLQICNKGIFIDYDIAKDKFLVKKSYLGCFGEDLYKKILKDDYNIDATILKN